MSPPKNYFNKELFIFRLNLIKELKGLSNKHLGVYFGVSEYVVANYLVGRTTPRPDILEKYASALGLNYDWVVGLVEEPMEKDVVSEPTFEYNKQPRNQHVPPEILAASNLIYSDIFTQLKVLSDRIALLELKIKKYESNSKP